MYPRPRQPRLDREASITPSIALRAMAAALYDQSQPAGRRHWAADGRWVKIPGNFKWWRD